MISATGRLSIHRCILRAPGARREGQQSGGHCRLHAEVQAVAIVRLVDLRAFGYRFRLVADLDDVLGRIALAALLFWAISWRAGRLNSLRDFNRRLYAGQFAVRHECGSRVGDPASEVLLIQERADPADCLGVQLVNAAFGDTEDGTDFAER